MSERTLSDRAFSTFEVQQGGQSYLQSGSRRHWITAAAVGALLLLSGLGVVIARALSGESSKPVGPGQPGQPGEPGEPHDNGLRDIGCRTGCSKGYKAKGYDFVAQAKAEPQGGRAWTGKESPPDVSQSDVGVAGVMAWAKAHTKWAEEEFAGSGERKQSPSDWSTSIIYNIQVDRFNNGDASNDRANMKPEEAKQVDDGTYKVDFRSGGDLEGILVRLPYLVDLGVNVIWLTPVLQDDGSYHGYCTTDLTRISDGFGTNELFKKLVTEAHKLDMLVVFDVVVNHMCSASVDHDTGYDSDRGFGSPDTIACANDMNKRNWDGDHGEETGLQAGMHFGSDFFGPFKDKRFFNRCGVNSRTTMQSTDPITVYGDFAPGMYDYNTRNADFQEVFTELMKFWIAYADVDGYRLDAAKHVSEDFIAYFSTHMRKYAASLGKDNFHIIGEVASQVDWQGRRLGAMASDLQDPNRHDYTLNVPKTLTKMLVNLKDDYLAHPKFPMPGLNSIYSFYSSGKGVAALSGKDSKGNDAYVGSLGWYWKDGDLELSNVTGQLDDCCYNKSDGCTAALTTWWIVLEIHDWPRFLQKNPYSIDFGVMGFVWLFTAPGAPVIYYGAEQGFDGLCPDTDKIEAGEGNDEFRQHCSDLSAHPYGSDEIKLDDFYRQDMFTGGPLLLGSAVSELNSMREINVKKLQKVELYNGSWQDDKMLGRDHPMYKATRRLVKLRKACPVLNFGRVRYGIPEDFGRPTKAVMVYSRLYKNQEAIIIINPGHEDGRTHYEFECDASINKGGDTYRNVLDKSMPEFKVRMDEGTGMCYVGNAHDEGKMKEYQAMVLMKDSDLIQSSGSVVYDPAYDGLAYCKPEGSSAFQV